MIVEANAASLSGSDPQPPLSIGNSGFQRGAAHPVVPHDGVNERIREHLGKWWLDAGSAPRLTFVRGVKQFGPGELSSHGSHFLRFQDSSEGGCCAPARLLRIPAIIDA